MRQEARYSTTRFSRDVHSPSIESYPWWIMIINRLGDAYLLSLKTFLHISFLTQCPQLYPEGPKGPHCNLCLFQPVSNALAERTFWLYDKGYFHRGRAQVLDWDTIMLALHFLVPAPTRLPNADETCARGSHFWPDKWPSCFWHAQWFLIAHFARSQGKTIAF